MTGYVLNWNGSVVLISRPDRDTVGYRMAFEGEDASCRGFWNERTVDSWSPTRPLRASEGAASFRQRLEGAIR